MAVVWSTAPPKVDLSALAGREIRVRAGDPLKIDVPISGAPTPTVTWQKDGKDLESSPRVCTLLFLKNTNARIHSLRLPLYDSGVLNNNRLVLKGSLVITVVAWITGRGKFHSQTEV